MFEVLLFAGLSVFAQSVPTQQTAGETITVYADSDPRIAIEDAERHFVDHEYEEATRILDRAIAEAQRPHTRAELNNCRAWLTMKTPAFDWRGILEGLSRAEAFAHRSVEEEPSSELYWHDYAAIRIRRALREGTFKTLDDIARRRTQYRWIGDEWTNPPTDAEQEAFVQAARVALAIETPAHDLRAILDTGLALTKQIEHAVLIDELLRERARAWPQWIALWQSAAYRDGTGAIFAELTSRPSGDLLAIAASTLPRLQRGEFDKVEGLLREAHKANPQAPDVLFLLTLNDVASRKADLADSDYCDLRALDQPSAFALHEAGIHPFIEAERVSYRAAASVLYLAKGARLIGAGEALIGAERRASRDEAELIRHDQIGDLQQQQESMNAALEELTASTKIMLEIIERNASAARKEIEQLRGVSESQGRELEEMRGAIGGLQSRLRLTQDQMEGLAVMFTEFRRDMETKTANIDRRLRTDERFCADLKQRLIGEVTILKNRMTEAENRSPLDERSKDFFKKSVLSLNENVLALNRWRYGDDVRQVRAMFIDIFKTTISTLTPPGSKLGAMATNILITMYEYLADYYERVYEDS